MDPTLQAILAPIRPSLRLFKIVEASSGLVSCLVQSRRVLLSSSGVVFYSPLTYFLSCLTVSSAARRVFFFFWFRASL